MLSNATQYVADGRICALEIKNYAKRNYCSKTLPGACMNDYGSQSSRWSSGQQLKQQLDTPVRSSPSSDRIGTISEQQQQHPQQFMTSYSSSVSSALAGIEHQLVVLRQENDMLQQQVRVAVVFHHAVALYALSAFAKRISEAA